MHIARGARREAPDDGSVHTAIIAEAKRLVIRKSARARSFFLQKADGYGIMKYMEHRTGMHGRFLRAEG